MIRWLAVGTALAAMARPISDARATQAIPTDPVEPAVACEAVPATPAPPPPPPAPRPDTDVPDVVAPPLSAYDGQDRTSAFLGVGHLDVIRTPGWDGPPGSDPYWTWPRHVLIPLFVEPDGEFAGWIDRGTVRLDDREPRKLTGAGMIETGYEDQTFLVLERHPGGWLRLRYEPPDDGGDGSGWTHACLLDLGEVALVLRSWRDRFEESGWLHFRSEGPHSLRAGPGPAYDRVAWIADDHDIEPLETRGDWMRVRVTQPAEACFPERTGLGKRDEGWIRWWDEEVGPRVFYHTRGC